MLRVVWLLLLLGGPALVRAQFPGNSAFGQSRGNNRTPPGRLSEAQRAEAIAVGATLQRQPPVFGTPPVAPIPAPPRDGRLTLPQPGDELQVLRSYETSLSPSSAVCSAAPVLPASTTSSMAGDQSFTYTPCFHLEYVCRHHCIQVYDYAPHPANNCPCCQLDVCLMLDHSGSLASYTDNIKQAYVQIVNEIFNLPNMAPRIAVVSHAPTQTEQALTPPFSDSPYALTRLINDVQNGNTFIGGDDFKRSLAACEWQFRYRARPNSRRIAFTITDGADPYNVAQIRSAARDLRFDPNPNVDTYCLYTRHPYSYWRPNGERNCREIGKAAGRFLRIVNPSSYASYRQQVNQFVDHVYQTCQPAYVYPPTPPTTAFSVIGGREAFDIERCPRDNNNSAGRRGGDSSNSCPSRADLARLQGP